MYAIRASWAGTNTHAGSTTETITTAVIPLLLAVLIVIAIITIVVALIVAVASRRPKRDSVVSMGPQPSTFS
jgi:hypothetical protein